MASSIFRVSRTETEGQQSGPATLNKAQEPVKMRVYEDESDVDLSEIGDKEIFAVEEENDLANVYVTDLVQEGNMNPVTSNAVARFTGSNYSTSEVKTSNTWIDGKPIYRKVFVSDSDALSSSTRFNIPYLGVIVNQGVLYRRTQGDRIDSCTPAIYKAGSGETAYVILAWSTYSSFTGGYSWWIEYTKTTD